jgi:hypothetical protein
MKSRNELKTFIGPDCVEEMIIYMYRKGEECIKEMREIKNDNAVVLTGINIKIVHVVIYVKKNLKKMKMKVRDHDHVTGKFRGAAHSKCNINFYHQRYIPVVFHNLKGYDGHFIIQKMYNICNVIKL